MTALLSLLRNILAWLGEPSPGSNDPLDRLSVRQRDDLPAWHPASDRTECVC